MGRVPHAPLHCSLRIHQQEVPAFFVDGQPVPPIIGELVLIDRTILQIHAATQSLHFSKQFGVAVGVGVHSLKVGGNLSTRGSHKQQSRLLLLFGGKPTAWLDMGFPGRLFPYRLCRGQF